MNQRALSLYSPQKSHLREWARAATAFYKANSIIVFITRATILIRLIVRAAGVVTFLMKLQCDASAIVNKQVNE